MTRIASVVSAPGPVLVMGAGAIGCYLGGSLQAAGAETTFVGRPRMLQVLRSQGLRLTDLDGADRTLAPGELAVAEAIPPGARPALVLLTVKSAATADAARALGAALPPGTLVVSMQNGASNAAIAHQAAPSLRVLPGMVPFNVAELAPGHFHRGTGGILAAQDDPALRPWVAFFAAAGLPLELHPDLRGIQWAKLLINLNNPVNALSGLPLRRQLLERDFRICVAALQREGLAALAAAGIVPARLTPLPPAWMPTLLALPTPLFRLVAARTLRIDAKARSSMADDFARGRPTEIDALCGEIVRLGHRHGVAMPVNEKTIELVRQSSAQPRAWSGAELRAALGLG
jgi:2-dehydropantoate 2-reductase